MTARWQGYVQKRLSELEAGEGEDLWEGAWPTRETVATSRRILLETIPQGAPAPSVVPTDEGAVAFIWHKGGWTIELEVCEGAGTDVLMYQRGAALDDMIHGPLNKHRSRLHTLLTALSR